MYNKKQCAYDQCCEFQPASWNQLYCVDCHCKRKAENNRKRIDTVSSIPAEPAEIVERDRTIVSLKGQLANTRKLYRESLQESTLATKITDDNSQWTYTNAKWCLKNNITSCMDVDLKSDSALIPITMTTASDASKWTNQKFSP